MLIIARACIISLFFSLGVSAAQAEQYIRVASFNIANLGDTSEYERSLISLVNILRQADADVVAIQEVEPNELGTDQVKRFVDLLNKAADFYGTQRYDYAIADDHTGDETTAFLWRSPVSLQSEITLLQHDPDPDNDDKPTFQRVPSVALFKAVNYDFYLVNCHLYTKLTGTSSEGRGEEYAALVAWMKELADESETDAIIVGDFNRFLNGKTDWSKLMVAEHADYFRFPLLEAIAAADSSFDPATDEAPDDQYSTTTAKKKSIYDQILVAKGSYHEFTNSPAFGEDVGIVAFDNDTHYEWFIDNWYNAIQLLSDHRPIWIRIRVDQPDDD
ncbi:MAG: endonuclease/exonuclease/phosphatase family protein [Phycisphaerales bacterium]|nr:endonuclease/exonuclease/phosphatase family protein [Phycisphaerales bacterium]